MFALLLAFLFVSSGNALAQEGELVWKITSELVIKTADAVKLKELKQEYPDNFPDKSELKLVFAKITITEFLRVANHTCAENDPRLHIQILSSSACYEGSDGQKECEIKVGIDPSPEDPCRS